MTLDRLQELRRLSASREVFSLKPDELDWLIHIAIKSEHTQPQVWAKGDYRVVKNGSRVVLEYRSKDALGSPNWIFQESWNTQNTNAQSCKADIAFATITEGE